VTDTKHRRVVIGKKRYVLFYYSASAEVQSPGGEMLQPMAFPKEKVKNRECPWVKGSSGQAAGGQGLPGLPGRGTLRGSSKLRLS